MKNSRTKKKETKKNLKSKITFSEVLYQKMGDRWFAFFVVDDEVFVGSTPKELFDSGLMGKKFTIAHEIET